MGQLQAAEYTWNWSLLTRGRGRKNICWNNGQNFSKSNENCKSTDLRGPINPKHKKNKESYKKAYHNKIIQNQWWRKNFKSAREKRYVICRRKVTMTTDMSQGKYASEKKGEPHFQNPERKTLWT